MNDVAATTEPERRALAPLKAGGQLAAILPQSLEETFRLATAIQKSGLAPKDLNTVEKVLVAIMAGAELGLPPFQAVQAYMVTNGRPTIWGDAMLAVVRSNGFRVREWFEGEGEGLTAYCEVIRPDTGEVIVRSFSVADAKQGKLWGKRGREGQDTPWITFPQRMLQMRARSWSCRDGAPDVLKGFQMREEAEDYEIIRSERPEPTSLRERLEANPERSREGFNAENVIEAEVEEPTAAEALASVELPVGDTKVVETEVVETQDIGADKTEAEIAGPQAQSAAPTADSASDTSASAIPASEASPAPKASGQPQPAAPSSDGGEADLFPGDKPAQPAQPRADPDERLRALFAKHVAEAKDWAAIWVAWVNFKGSHAYDSSDGEQRRRAATIALTKAAELVKADATAASPSTDPNLFCLWVETVRPPATAVQARFERLSLSPAYEALGEAEKTAVARAAKAAT